MRYSKQGNMYRVSRITGSQDNILGIVFSDNNAAEKDASKNYGEKIELVEWDTKEGAAIKCSGEQILEQVLSGLNKANEDLGKNYRISKIQYLPSDSASRSVYEYLIQALIKHYDTGNEFLELAS